jgi:hypothetical protein
MASLDEQTVADLLAGDPDPRNVALFLAQKSHSMDAVERDQRETILRALEVNWTRTMAKATVDLARQTRNLAFLTGAVVVVTLAVGLIGLVAGSD